MIYDVHYFIKKFEAIPENLWCMMARAEGDQRCALGWCYPTKELAIKSQSSSCIRYECKEETALTKLVKILDKSWGAGGINNGIYQRYQQPTPKQRILAALYDIRAMQDPKVKTVYVTVSEVIKDETKKLILN